MVRFFIYQTLCIINWNKNILDSTSVSNIRHFLLIFSGDPNALPPMKDPMLLSPMKAGLPPRIPGKDFFFYKQELILWSSYWFRLFRFFPPVLYSWSIRHILEHVFFWLAVFAAQGEKNLYFWANFEGVFFFQLFEVTKENQRTLSCLH